MSRRTTSSSRPLTSGRAYAFVAALLVAASAQAAPVTDIGPTPTGATAAPTGVTAVPTGSTTIPTGATTTPIGATAAPAGVTAVPTGVQSTPRGVTATPTSRTAAPSGVTAVPTPGAPVDGATTPPAGLSETPRGTSSPFGPQAPQTTVLYDLPGGAILLPADLEAPAPADAETLSLDDGQAPPIWYGPLELTDDASLGAFCDAGYDSVDGTLVVTGAVTDLRGIDCLTWVGGDLIVEEADDLLVFDGFPLLVEVRGTLELRDLPLADPVLGFDSLVRVGGDVRLEQLFATTEVPWFPVLGEVGGHIEVFELDALTELQWMPQLAILGGSVDISDNQRLEWIAELPNLASVSDHVSIRWNPSLQDQDLVPALDWIGGDLEFWGNQMAALQLDGVIVDGYVDAGLR